MKKIEFGMLPTMIGSVPYTDAQKAMLQVIKYLPQLSAWPQLPQRNYRESMVAQFSQGFPGLILNNEGDASILEIPFAAQLQKLYEDHLSNNTDDYALGSDYAIGLQTYLQAKFLGSLVAKGQIVGPLTFSLSVKDENGRAILYDETKKEAACLFLRLKALWQERVLLRQSPNTMIFLDEPALASFGSAYLNVSEETVAAMLGKTLDGLQGYKGIHVCGGTNWEILLKMPQVDVINFDAYKYAYTLQVYQDQLKIYWQNGKTIAWGIVPTDEKDLKEETVHSLKDRLEENIAYYTRAKDSPSFKEIVAQSLLTPSCGLGALSEDACDQAMQILAELSTIMRRKYL